MTQQWTRDLPIAHPIRPTRSLWVGLLSSYEPAVQAMALATEVQLPFYGRSIGYLSPGGTSHNLVARTIEMTCTDGKGRALAAAN